MQQWTDKIQFCLVAFPRDSDGEEEEEEDDDDVVVGGGWRRKEEEEEGCVEETLWFLQRDGKSVRCGIVAMAGVYEKKKN